MSRKNVWKSHLWEDETLQEYIPRPEGLWTAKAADQGLWGISNIFFFHLFFIFAHTKLSLSINYLINM